MAGPEPIRSARPDPDGADMSGARINGRDVEIRPGETIGDAVARAGFEIPSLCRVPGLPPEASCRLCLVHSSHHARPLAACHTPLEPGMDLQTDHPEVERWRRSLLRLFAETAGMTGFRLDRVRRGRFADLLRRYRIGTESLPGGPAPAAPPDEAHPLIGWDRAACLSCGACVTVCAEWAGRQVWERSDRGSRFRVGPAGGRSLRESPCTACGACVDHCPTGAIRDRGTGEVPMAGPPDADSVCGFCSVGCRIRVTAGDGEVSRVAGGAGQAEPNPWGLLCHRGRTGFLAYGSWDRLSRPMIREGAGFREVDWEEALRFLALRLKTIVETRGPGAFGALASPRATVESAFLLQKLCRSVIGSPHVDSPAGLYQGGIFEALHRTLGLGAGTASFADIDAAGCLVVAGADPDRSHPVLADRIHRALARGARLLVIDPRVTDLARKAEVHLQIAPGGDGPVLRALARGLIESGWIDRGFLDRRVDGVEALAAAAGRTDVVLSCRAAAVDPAVVVAFAAFLGRYRGNTLFVSGIGLSRPGGDIEATQALLNLALLTGNLGRPGAGFLPLGGQNNLQGCLDAGAAPHLLPGQLRIDDAVARQRVEQIWGYELPDFPGLPISRMAEAASRGDLRALWVMGHEAARWMPEASLGNLDLLVVQDLFYTETARNAHLLLPAASAFEQTGVFINAERRAQLVRAAVPPPAEARPDWEILTAVARRLGAPWPYREAAQVFAELAMIAPERFAGITHRRLGETPGGIQWPCPEPAHPGTATLHEGRFETPSGRARLEPPSSAPAPAPGSVPAAEYPLLLLPGRSPEHHNSGSETRRGPVRQLADRDRLWLHPDQAGALGIREGERVRIESARGWIEAEAGFTTGMRPGQILLTDHFPQTRSRRLGDPLRAIAVRLRPADSALPGGGGEHP